MTEAILVNNLAHVPPHIVEREELMTYSEAYQWLNKYFYHYKETDVC